MLEDQEEYGSEDDDFDYDDEDMKMDEEEVKLEELEMNVARLVEESELSFIDPESKLILQKHITIQ